MTRSVIQPQSPSESAARFPLGLLSVTVGLAASTWLMIGHFNAAALPGCGPGSACEQLARGPWGQIPGLNWPVSFVGFAYFDALLAAWVVSRGRLAPLVRAATWLGTSASIVLLLVMLSLGRLCGFCLAVHVANLVFVANSEARRPAADTALPPRMPPATAIFIAILLGTTGALVPVKLLVAAQATQDAESKLAASVAEMKRAASRPADGMTELPATGPTYDAAGSRAANRDSADSSRARTPDAASGGALPGALTGRHRQGPAVAAIRLVVFSDYQCTDCRRIDGELRALAASRTDLSITARHFPMCTDCNRHMPAGSNMHPNACWAARAAEAAGIVAGVDGFWRMHRWLFDHGGAFTDAEFDAALAELGFDRAALVRAMTGDETLRLVREDVDLAVELGLHFTPMIFINGVELRGWNAPNAVQRAVEALAATHPPPATWERDVPARAADKYVEDWRQQPARPMPDARDWSIGAADGDPAVDVVVFGDYSEPNTAALDAMVREIVAQQGKSGAAAVGDDVSGIGKAAIAPQRGLPSGGVSLRYHFRHFPFNKDCNPTVKSTRFPNSCLAARTVEAAGLLGGGDAFWRIHEWLLQHQAGFSEAALPAAAAAAGIDAAGLQAALSRLEVGTAIADDVAAGERLSIRSIPTLFVNGRWVPRWRLGDAQILERIITAASLQR